MSMLRHFQAHVPPVETDATVVTGRLRDALQYGCHVSATRDTTFFRTNLEAHITMGHIVVLPWADVRQLSWIWISPLFFILQEG